MMSISFLAQILCYWISSALYKNARNHKKGFRI